MGELEKKVTVIGVSWEPMPAQLRHVRLIDQGALPKVAEETGVTLPQDPFLKTVTSSPKTMTTKRVF